MSEQKKPSIEIEHFSFYYPEQAEKTLDDLTLTVEQGEFLVLCGPSGCGKSTLLRQLKTVLAPHGRRLGSIRFEGCPLEELDQREQSAGIGFVQQDPENQIVTDKVWHELAFGLESLGYDTPTIRRRVAEMASFFGIQTWFYKNVTELSGGQKQLLNLASIMAMQPSVLILDEPTSQLDPIAAADFLATLGKINRELGTTVVLTEHRLEDAFPLASRVAVMDRGRLLCTGSPAEVGAILRGAGHSMFLAMPTPMRIWASAPDAGGHCPVTVREGRDWLTKFADGHPLMELPSEPRRTYPNEPAITAEGLWFKYEKELPDVVKGLSLTVRRGEFLALLGGNGTGKTTSLKLLSGLQKPYRGEVRLAGSVGVLPQNPQALFVKKTVREDLFEILKGRNFSGKAQEERVAWAVRLCRLEGLLDRHPYDLSGGEQQRAALAKVLLLGPEILLMDEPTKGLDAEFKQVFAEILQSLLRQGVTLLMVSHDIEFCARYAHRCALFFDGSIVTEAPPRAFFSGNSFYTTSANRMARGLLPEAVTAEDVIQACGGNLPPAPELPDSGEPLPEPEEASADYKPKPLPWWRKLGAVLTGTVSFLLFLSFMNVTDLTQLITADGMTELANHQMILYALFILSLFLFATCITRRSHRKDYALQVPKAKRKLAKRTVVAAVLVLLMIPLTLYIGVFYLDNKKYYFISLLVLLECMLPFFLIFEGRKPQARELVIIAVLCAIGIAGRAALFMLPQFKPVMAVTIIAGVAFGGETGFLVGAMTMLASNVLFGQGPLTPWQMFSMGIIGFLAGILFRKGLLRRNRGALCVFGALAAILIYGGIMNPASALTWVGELNEKVLLTYYISGLPFDCIQAAATWLFLWFGAEPMLEKLDRVKVKYGVVER
ncbi:ATP-binding cassette domain-containing protein [Flavonifractor plautii]|nr:ECF transporter S component [Flavonifractor plautii]UBS60340.1 ATP-binding cassette domain-containing protein [Flavonifractor plautii]UYJ50667.1 MAG: ATP-binding cassette domain-containing protein [Flavonifractor plautii]